MGPIYGGYMEYLVGYRISCDIVAIVLVAFSVLFYIFTRNYVKVQNASKALLEKAKNSRSL